MSRWAGSVASMDEIKSCIKILIRTTEYKRALEKWRCRW